MESGGWKEWGVESEDGRNGVWRVRMGGMECGE